MSLSIRIFTIIFIVFVLISPWIYPIIQNRSEIFPVSVKINYADREILLSEANSLRGEVVGVINPVAIKILTNKLVLTGRHYLNIYFQSYDPGFLFFSGTDDPLMSTKNTGSFYVIFLPLILIGLYRLVSVKKLKTPSIILLTISPLPATLVGWPLNPMFLVFFFLTLTFFAATGFTHLFFKHRKMFILFSIILIFEITRFLHILINHYPPK